MGKHSLTSKLEPSTTVETSDFSLTFRITLKMVKERKNRMFVKKRDGREEEVHFDKITSRIQKLCYGLDDNFIEATAITMKVIQGLYAGVTTVELDNLAAEIAATMTTKHPDYAILAARIVISNLQKETKKVFSEVITDLYNMRSHDRPTPMISEEHYKIIMANFANRSRRKKYGQPSWSRKSKRAHLICYTKTPVIENPINKILVLSSVPICAQKSLNTAAPTRLLCAI